MNTEISIKKKTETKSKMNTGFDAKNEYKKRRQKSNRN